MAIRGRLAELEMSINDLARKTGLDPTTIRSAINGEHWPRAATREKIAEALGWPVGEVSRRALVGPTLENATWAELMNEVCRRVRERSRFPRDGDFVPDTP